MNKCTFCGREANSGTKHVGGYTILECCTDCERDITAETITIQISPQMRDMLIAIVASAKEAAKPQEKPGLSFKQLNALVTLRDAYYGLARAWDEDGTSDFMLDRFSQAPWLPQLELDEAGHALQDVIEEHQPNRTIRYFIDLNEDSDQYWVYMQRHDGTIADEMNLSEYGGDASRLTAITKRQYEEIQDAWNIPEEEWDTFRPGSGREDAIKEILAEPISNRCPNPDCRSPHVAKRLLPRSGKR